MYYKRLIDKHLEEWVSDPDKKPLLIRGARQVGKSSSVRELGKKFNHFIEVNFELFPALKVFFKNSQDPLKLVEDLSLYFNKPIIPSQSLLFFDEIQACPEAITSLRFFYEQIPNLHVISSGSLIEFALQDLPTFGVGRVRSIFMYPFSFDEFLIGGNQLKLLELKKSSSIDNPLPDIFHQKLIDLLKTFILLGGMPEVVSKYLQTRQLMNSQLVLDDLWIGIHSDLAKYKKSVPATRLSEVLYSVIKQTGNKFNVDSISDNSNHKQLKDALELLILAGLVIPVIHSSSNGIPLGSEINSKKRKMLLLDTGLAHKGADLDLSEITLYLNSILVNKGKIAEQFWGLEYLKYESVYKKTSLYYWQRESPSSSAEVDYVIQKENEIFPVEIKSSVQGGMKSLNLFLKEKGKALGYRFSLENFSSYNNIHVYPLYAVSNLFIEK